MFELPEIVVGGGTVDARVGRARGTLVVEFQLAMEREAIFDVEDQRRRILARTGSDLRIDLPVLIGVSTIQFS